MGTKLSITTISTLTLLGGLLAPVAVWADEIPKTQWTYAEMATLSAELEPEIDAACGDGDPMCREMFFWSTHEYNDINRALGHYREHGVTVTAINLDQHTIRVAYDADVVSMGPSYRYDLKDLYVIQLENGYTSGAYAREIDNGNDAALTHITRLFVKNDTAEGDNWLPHGTELELSVPDLSIADNLQKHIYVTYRLANGSTWSDYFDFSSCLSALGEGMECKIMYEANSYTYIAAPVEQPTAEPEPSTGADTDVDAGADTNTGTGTDAGTDADASAGVTDDSTADETTQDSIDDTMEGYGSDSATSTEQISLASVTTTKSPVLAPDTGAAVEGNSGDAFEFPWWAGAIVGLNVLVLVWLLWPLPKDPKNHKVVGFRKKITKKC